MRKPHSSSDNERPHSVDMGVKERYPWVYAVPCKKVMPKICDELPDEFRRAGIRDMILKCTCWPVCVSRVCNTSFPLISRPERYSCNT